MWNDFNAAEDQNGFNIIPKGTLAKVRMIIRPGAYDDASQGWTGGWATKGDSGAVYLDCEFIVLAGEYAKRKVWCLIGLHSPKGDAWANIGRSFVKGILNSARGIKSKDDSPSAQAARRIQGLGDLDGLEFVARIDVEKSDGYPDKNTIKVAITPDHKDYDSLMAQTASVAPAQAQAPSTNTPQWG